MSLCIIEYPVRSFTTSGVGTGQFDLRLYFDKFVHGPKVVPSGLLFYTSSKDHTKPTHLGEDEKKLTSLFSLTQRILLSWMRFGRGIITLKSFSSILTYNNFLSDDGLLSPPFFTTKMSSTYESNVFFAIFIYLSGNYMNTRFLLIRSLPRSNIRHNSPFSPGTS